jgi:hypothetical protein
LQDDNGSAWLVVAGIKPIPIIERAIAVRLVERVVVEMINRDRDIVLGIQERRVNIALEQILVADGVSLHIESAPLRPLFGIWEDGEAKSHSDFPLQRVQG